MVHLPVQGYLCVKIWHWYKSWVLPWASTPRLFALSHNTTLPSAIQLFNSFVPQSEAINSEAFLLTLVTQKSLSSKLDDHLIKVLLDVSSIANTAHQLSPSEGLHLDPSQFHVAIKWLRFLMVLAAHCALRLLLTHSAITQKGWSPQQTMWCLVCQLIWVSRWKWMSPPITATPIQLTFGFQTGSWASLHLLTCRVHPRLIPQFFWKREWQQE